MTRAMEREERALQFVYEHRIDAKNYTQYEAQLRPMFEDEAAYRRFVDDYFTEMDSIRWEQFFAAGQHVDAFHHPRFSQQTPHVHNFYELKYQLQGSGTVVVGEDAVWLRESDFCLIAPHMPHLSEIFDMNSDMINIVIVPEFLPLIFPRLSREPELLERIHMSAAPGHVPLPFTHIPTHNDPEIRARVEEIYRVCREEEAPSPMERLCAEAALEQIFLRLLRNGMNGESSTLASAPNQSRQAKRMMDYLQSHLSDASFSGFAEYFHYSESYASRFFKSCTGQTFSAVLRALRLKRAAELLIASELSVDEIMRQVGYSGRTNFYNSFRRCYGSTPSDFRRARSEMS